MQQKLSPSIILAHLHVFVHVPIAENINLFLL